MASDGYCLAKFSCTSGNSFYFEAHCSETDLVEDSFRMSDLFCKHLIRSKDNKFLLLNEGHFQAQNLTIREQRQTECVFNIHNYNKDTIDFNENRKKRAVMLYAVKDGLKMVACCNENHEICPEAMDLPHIIDENAHKAVFYLIDLPGQTNKFMFESSLYPNKYLGFEPCECGNPSLNKLVLRHKAIDEVDEYCEVSFSNAPQNAAKRPCLH